MPSVFDLLGHGRMCVRTVRLAMGACVQFFQLIVNISTCKLCSSVHLSNIVLACSACAVTKLYHERVPEQ